MQYLKKKLIVPIFLSSYENTRSNQFIFFTSVLFIYLLWIQNFSNFIMSILSFLFAFRNENMPLVRRSIQPQDLCRKKLPEHVESELEMVTNNALCGVISQLSGSLPWFLPLYITTFKISPDTQRIYSKNSAWKRRISPIERGNWKKEL